MSCISDLFWKEGLSMDSSIFSDDDIFEWRSPASSPKRCDRASAHTLPTPDHSTHRTPPLSRSSSCNCSTLEELFFYCTEELGSESTSGIAKTLYAGEDFTAAAPLPPPPPPQASSSGRCMSESYNWAFQPQACASSSCINSASRNKDMHPSSIKQVPSLPHTFRSNAPHRHHCDTALGGGGDRAFPPPITSLLTDRPLMRSFKSEGRFVLKKVTNVSRSLFRSTRENGHLRLDLLSCSFNRLESWYGRSTSTSPASQENPSVDSTSTPHFRHGKDLNIKAMPHLYDWFRPPSPYDIILHRQPSLDYESVCPPSKLQAIAMLMHPKDARASFVEESISSRSTPFQVEHLIKGGKAMGGKNNTAMVQSKPHVFALLKVLPTGLSLIIFEVGRSKGSDNVTMYGMYISKNFGLECEREASVSPSHHRLNGLLGVRSSCAKGRLSFTEDCLKNGYMKGVSSY